MFRSWIDAIRRNHGVEHATVAVLFTRTGPQRIAGRAAADGFFILGSVDRDLLLSCAHEALSRMQHGEPELAISPHCGTNIAVTAALTSLGTMRAFARHPERRLRDRFGDAFNASIIAIVAAQPLGRLVQRYLTTRADVQAMEIVEVRQYFPGVRKVITRGA
ncbi:MAG: DUF6391 domain-containing protein [Chloroflexota bacterium]